MKIKFCSFWTITVASSVVEQSPLMQPFRFLPATPHGLSTWAVPGALQGCFSKCEGAQLLYKATDLDCI